MSDDNSFTYRTATGNVPNEVIGDGQYFSYLAEKGKREKQQREEQQQRITNRDPTGLRTRVSKIKPYMEAMEPGFDRIRHLNTDGMTPDQSVHAAFSAAVECELCKRFKHWNLSVMIDHVHQHKEIIELRELYYQAERNYESLQKRQ